MMSATTIFRSMLARAVVLAEPQLRPSSILLSLAAIVSMLICGTAAATPPSQAGAPIGLITADFNHDGIPDVLSPGFGNSLTISFGAVPYGSFQTAARTVPFPALCANLNNNGAIIGDFNGDGFPDIALSCFGGQFATPQIFILLGNGDGTFTAGAQVAGLSNLIAADFNKDGKVDIVTEGANANNQQTLMFYAGNGDGTFAAAVTTTISNVTYGAMAAVDLNRDGYPDLVLGFFGSSSVNTLYVFGNNQNGTFGVAGQTSALYSPNTSAGVGSYPAVTEQSILVGNFFGNGAGDLAVPDSGTSPGVFVVKNTSSGSTYSLAAAVKTSVTGLSSAVTANIVSPVYSDLLVYTGSKLTVLANDGAGNFSASYAGLTVANTSSLYTTADANADGHADIYIGAANSNGTAVTVDLISGSASATSTAFSLPAGTIPVSATWPGNTNFTGSTAAGSQIVNAVATTLVMTSSKNPCVVGDSVRFTATVAPLSSGQFSPTGSVTFIDGTLPLGTMPLLSDGTASLTTTALSAGSHTIRAAYSGDTVFAGSSMTLSQAVNANAPVITWTTPAAITYGTPLSAAQLNATAANSSGTGIPGTFIYNPAAGTVLNAGTQTLSVTFTPQDNVTYTTATRTVSLVVNPATPTLTFTPTVSTITYGTPLGASQLNATATGVGGASVPGTFVYTPTAGTVLGVGSQTIGVVFTPSSPNYTTQTGGARVTVTQATPTLVWTTPSPIAYGVPLSATQLNATATGVTGAALPGTFTYNPPAGTVLGVGSQTLTVVFTPTDAVNYTTATTSVKLSVTDLVFTSFTPNTATIGDAAKTITITGSGFVATTVAQVGTTALATTLVNATTLTAVVPASNFVVAATLQISLKSPATGTTSQSLPLTVTAPAPSVTVTAPATAPAGTQPAVTLAITNPYPVPLVATFTLTNSPSGTPAVDDPAVQFATGGRVDTFTIPAGTTTVPNVQVQTGTVAGSITVALVLTANGVNVTPASVATPLVISVPAAVPSVTAASLTRSGSLLTVTIAGFSNDREIVKANFHFVAAPGFNLSTPDVQADVAAAFATWFANPQSLQYGSTFHYAQDFNVSDDASHVGSVVVTLTNKLGISTSQTAQ